MPTPQTLPTEPTNPNLDARVRRYMQLDGTIMNFLLQSGQIVQIDGGWVIVGTGAGNIGWYPLSNAVHFSLG